MILWLNETSGDEGGGRAGGLECGSMTEKVVGTFLLFCPAGAPIACSSHCYLASYVSNAWVGKRDTEVAFQTFSCHLCSSTHRLLTEMVYIPGLSVSTCWPHSLLLSHCPCCDPTHLLPLESKVGVKGERHSCDVSCARRCGELATIPFLGFFGDSPYWFSICSLGTVTKMQCAGCTWPGCATHRGTFRISSL